MGDTFPDRLETCDVVQKLRQSNSDMNDELAEKKQSVKLLQQRMNDMKKTFQKEMKSAAQGAGHQSGPVVTDDEESVAAAVVVPTMTSSLTNGTAGNDSANVDLAYLKHVIFKFLTSREYEAKQLTRAVATLLQFSKDEDKLLRDHLEWKTSWFGNLTTAKPDLGQGQFSLSMPPI